MTDEKKAMGSGAALGTGGAMLVVSLLLQFGVIGPKAEERTDKIRSNYEAKVEEMQGAVQELQGLIDEKRFEQKDVYYELKAAIDNNSSMLVIIDERLRSGTASRWTQQDMQLWISKMAASNPDLNVVSVDNVVKYRE